LGAAAQEQVEQREELGKEEQPEGAGEEERGLGAKAEVERGEKAVAGDERETGRDVAIEQQGGEQEEQQPQGEAA
jgi:hypothetical protein